MFITSILSLMFACGPKQNTGVVAASQVTAPAVDSGEIPQWVLMPPVGKNEICATGAYKMKGNISMAQQQSAQLLVVLWLVKSLYKQKHWLSRTWKREKLVVNHSLKVGYFC